MVTVHLGLGSNLGDRQRHLEAAIDALAAFAPVRAVSPIYDTDPMYVSDQPRYLNMAVAAETALSPFALLDRLKELEQALGRVPNVRYGARVIDLDILLYGDIVLRSKELTIPHPRMAERAFVLQPLADIAPAVIHPGLGVSIDRLKQVLDTSEGVGQLARFAEAKSLAQDRPGVRRS